MPPTTYHPNKTQPTPGGPPPNWEHLADFRGSFTQKTFSLWINTKENKIYQLIEGDLWSAAKEAQPELLRRQARLYLQALRKTHPEAKPLWTERSAGHKP